MRIVKFCGAVLFLFVGLLQLWMWSIDFHSARQAAAWPSVPGTVTKSTVVEDRSGRGVAHYPAVSYTYKVEGTSLVGNRIHFRDGSETAEQAKRTAGRYPVGSAVTVYYNQNDPSESMLAPGLYWYTWAWLALAVTAVLVGSAGVYFYRPSRRNLSAA